MSYALDLSFRSLAAPSAPRRPPGGVLSADALTQARDGDSMESKIDRNRSTTADFVRDLRPKIEEMVNDHEASSGAKMRAYTIVGRAVGRSQSWVRRLIGHQDVGLSVEIYCRAVAAYEAHCARIEQRAAAKMRQAEQWRRETDALGVGSPHELPRDTGRSLGAVAPRAREAPS